MIGQSYSGGQPASRAGGRAILLTGSDAAAIESLAARLGCGGEFELATASSASAALAQSWGGRADAVIIVLPLTDMEGSELCRLLRARGLAVPILLVGRNSEAEAILGLDSGANDYLTPPFNSAVLVARLRAHLRQYDRSDDALYRIGPYLFRPATRQLVEQASGRKIRLTPKEAAMLRYLHANSGSTVSRESLMRRVWGYSDEAATHTVETHIYRLRRKLAARVGLASLLESVPGGYRIAAS